MKKNTKTKYVKKHNLGVGIVQVLIANFINLLVSVCNGFVIPKYLSISSYAGYKTFLLYINYVGILHLGFIDGMYIKYGGKSIHDISKEEVSSLQVVLLIFQGIVTILCLLFAPFIKDIYFFLAILSILPTNMLVFYRFLFQAIGEFGNYRKILNAQVISVFIFNIFLLLVLNIDDARIYSIGYLVICMLVWIYFAYHMRELRVKVHIDFRSMFDMWIGYIKAGFIIMLGNFMTVWIAGIDRWFVKFCCSENEFAYYSFAVSLLKLVNAVFSAFSITLYNYFCEHSIPEQVSSIRKKIVLIGSLIISCLFMFKIVVDKFLPKYIPAQKVMLLLIASQLFVVLVNAIYLNLYKAFNLQKRYLKIMIEISIIAIVTNIIFGKILDFSMESFAYATFFTMLIWYILCQIDLKEYKSDMREWIYILLIVSIFISTGSIDRFVNIGNEVITKIFGFILYILLYCIISIVLFKNEIKQLVFIGLEFVKEKLNKAPNKASTF